MSVSLQLSLVSLSISFFDLLIKAVDIFASDILYKFVLLIKNLRPKLYAISISFVPTVNPDIVKT
jgi:hypothetical protein